MVLSADKEDKRIAKNANFYQSLKIAVYGIRTAVREESNMRLHLLFIVLVLIAGILLHLNVNEWLWISLAVALVVFGEMVNSIIERIVDLIVGQSFHPQAKIIKDMAAGAVLVYAVFAIIVGVLIFGPKLLQLL